MKNQITKTPKNIYNPFMLMIRNIMMAMYSFISGRPMMKCEEYVNLMSAYIDKDLEKEDRALWLQHFKACKDCNRFYRGVRNSIKLVDYIQDKPCPFDMSQRLENLLVEKAKAKQAETQVM